MNVFDRPNAVRRFRADLVEHLAEVAEQESEVNRDDCCYWDEYDDEYNALSYGVDTYDDDDDDAEYEDYEDYEDDGEGEPWRSEDYSNYPSPFDYFDPLF